MCEGNEVEADGKRKGVDGARGGAGLRALGWRAVVDKEGEWGAASSLRLAGRPWWERAPPRLRHLHPGQGLGLLPTRALLSGPRLLSGPLPLSASLLEGRPWLRMKVSRPLSILWPLRCRPIQGNEGKSLVQVPNGSLPNGHPRRPVPGTRQHDLFLAHPPPDLPLVLLLAPHGAPRCSLTARRALLPRVA